MDSMKMNNGQQIPSQEFGVFLVENNGPCEEAMLTDYEMDEIRTMDKGVGTYDPEDMGNAEQVAALKVHD